MKWLPWILLVLLAATFLFSQAEQPATNMPATLQPNWSAGEETETPLLLPSNRPAHAELESDLLRELLDEIRGLRQELREPNTTGRQSLTSEEPSAELKRLASAVEKLIDADKAVPNPLQLPAPGLDFSQSFKNLAMRYRGSRGSDALTDYQLETKQFILDEFGRPNQVEGYAQGVLWSYDHGAGEREWSLSFLFFEGRVAAVTVNGLE